MPYCYMRCDHLDEKTQTCKATGEKLKSGKVNAWGLDYTIYKHEMLCEQDKKNQDKR